MNPSLLDFHMTSKNFWHQRQCCSRLLLWRLTSRLRWFECLNEKVSLANLFIGPNNLEMDLFGTPISHIERPKWPLERRMPGSKSVFGKSCSEHPIT